MEAGIILYDLYVFLMLHGLYLSIQPGHGRIMVGGCIAADVHGKNHACDGTFINHAVSLTLVHPALIMGYLSFHGSTNQSCSG